MSEKEKFEFQWEKYVEEIYYLNENFNYVHAKKLARNVKTFQYKIEKKIREVSNTLLVTDFNNQIIIKKELEELLVFCNDMFDYLNNFTKLKPKTKLGYNNYISNAIAFLT